jgi:hypothetical protein
MADKLVVTNPAPAIADRDSAIGLELFKTRPVDAQRSSCRAMRRCVRFAAAGHRPRTLSPRATALTRWVTTGITNQIQAGRPASVMQEGAWPPMPRSIPVLSAALPRFIQ